MTNLQTILNLINRSNGSVEAIMCETNLSLTQITEAVRPVIQSGNLVKTGRGKSAIYTLTPSDLTETPAPEEAEEIETPTDEVITLKQMCEKHDIAPMTARRKLRKAGITKPGKQWAWSVFSNEAMTMVLNIIVNR